jgi:drug/metabolite transporter (DMT)-like permease
LQTSRTYYWWGATMVLSSAFMFALKGVFIKVSYQYGIDTISVLALRMIFSSPFYVAIALWLHQKTKTELTNQPLNTDTLRLWFWIGGLGMTGYYLASFLDFLSLKYISASLERVFLFIYPTFVLFINAFFHQKSPSRLQLTALAMTYCGIVIAFIENIDATGQGNLFLGTFWVMASGLVYACYLVGSDGVIQKAGSQSFTVYTMLFATIPTLVHCWLSNGLHLWHYDSRVYWLCGSMAVFSTVIPTFMMSEGIKRVGSSNTSIVGSIGPIFTIVLATNFLGEHISAIQLLGTAFVLFGVFLIGWKGKK